MSPWKHVAPALAALGLMWLVAGATGRASQPTDDPSGSPTSEPSPAEIIARARSAYRSGAIAERVTIAVRDGDITRFDEYVVRLRADDQVREMRLEMATLSIWARTDGQGGQLAARHRENDQVTYRADLDRPLSHLALRGRLPRIVAPQLALAFGEQLEPSVADEEWTRGPPAQNQLSVIAATDQGLVTLAFDASSFRLREYRVEAGRFTILLRVEPIEPGDPESWKIASEGSRVVSSLSELRPRPRQVSVGEEFPFQVLQDATMSPWAIDVALANRRVPPQRPEERYLVLVFHRVPGDAALRETVLQRVGKAIDAASRVERELARISMRAEGLGPRHAIVRVIVRPVACLTVLDARRDVIDSLATRWPLDTGGSGLLWTVSPERTIDRLSAGADAVIAVIDDQLRLVRIMQMESGLEVDALAADIRDTIMREVTLIGGP